MNEGITECNFGGNILTQQFIMRDLVSFIKYIAQNDSITTPG